MANQDDARRVQNKHNAMALARNGIPVFPSSGKVPLIKLYNRRDTEISPEDRAAAIEKAREEGNTNATVFVGATCDPDLVKRMWRAPNWDAVPSIPCGPARLVVLDADTKFNGPELIAKLFESHGGVPDGTPIITSQSGGKHYVFSDPDNAFTNSAGALKKQYGCDVRGRGGQFVAPGSIREDGKTYGDSKTLKDFIAAYTAGTIPPLPDYIVELIGTSSSELGEEIAPSKEREIIKQLSEAEVPEWEDLCTPLGDYDFDKLQSENTEFKQLFTAPGDDCSDNRFKAARHVMREWPHMPPEHLASFFLAYDGAGEYTDEKPRSGEYDNRQTAREWLKNQGLSKSSTGEAFGAVVDEDEHDSEEHPTAPLGTMYYANDAAFYSATDFIIENLCAPGQLGVIYGASNVGKTFAVIHLGDCVADGKKWFGKQTEKSGALYMFAEGKDQFNNRLAAYRKRYPSDTKGMIVHKGIPPIAQTSGIKAIGKAIEEANAWQAANNLPPVRLAFIDTFAKAVAGADENNAKEMQPILNALRKMAEKHGVCVIIVHHTGKDTTAGSRGSYAIYADADFELELLSPETVRKKKLKIDIKPGQIAILSDKMRDGSKGGAALFRLEEIELGTNKWGNPATSVVVVPIEAPTGEAMGPVTDDEEPATLKDELTPEVNRSDDEGRLKLCARIIAIVKQVGKLVGKEVHADVEAVRLSLPALQALYDEAGADNFARAFKRRAFGGQETKRFVPAADGYLLYSPARGKNGSMLVFRPR
jgi:hypothetical protein